jgi:hypothetical protein
MFLFFLFLFDRLLFVTFRRVESLYYGSHSPSPLADKFAAAPFKGEYRVLILGTSRTYNGIHPGFIWDELGIRAFKEAYVGKGPMYNYYFYQEYKKYLGQPRVVIYGVDYFLFNITSERHWLKRFNEIQAAASKFSGGVSLLLANKPRLDEFINTFLNDLKNDIANESKYLNERDLVRMDTYRGAVSPGRISEEEPLLYRKVGFARFPGKEGIYFKRLIDELQKDRVQVLLVALPEYIGTYRTNHSQRKFQQFFMKFAKARPGVFFYNYDLPRKFDLSRADFFTNGGYGKANSHLSKAGSEVFNRLLLRDLRRHLGEK